MPQVIDASPATIIYLSFFPEKDKIKVSGAPNGRDLKKKKEKALRS
jgi:hypothetical protein